MRAKYAKLLANLANAVQALFGAREDVADLVRLARREGRACLDAAGIEFASLEEDAARRGDLLVTHPIEGAPRGGGSTWQSLERRTGSVEVDFLNGEIVLLGRLHGVPTPVNEALRTWANAAAARRQAPGTADLDEFRSQLALADG
jgi:2-dehydropantoate 2-reductase